MVSGEDELIVAMGAGELINETKSPPLRITVKEGWVALMPKDEPYALRNVGKRQLNILVIRMPPTNRPR